MSQFTFDASNNLNVNIQAASSPTPVAENVAQWGGTAVQAAQTAATDGTGAAPIVRATTRKFGQILTSTPLGASASFVSAWFDSNQTGDMYVMASCRTDQNGANPGLILDQTDDTANTNLQVLGTASVQVFANTFTTLGPAAIVRRYWRIRMVNFTTPQGTLEVAADGIPQFPYATGAGTAFLALNAVVTQANAQQGNGGDGVSNSLLRPIGMQLGSSFGPIQQDVFSLLFNGTTWDRPRTPSIYKTVNVTSATAGNSAVWTPAAGKKFRLMKFQINGSNLAATAAAVVTLSFQDNVTGVTIGTYSVLLPAVAGVVSGVVDISSGWIDIGNGYLSILANNVLNLNVSAAPAGATGSYRVNVCGTEE